MNVFRLSFPAPLSTQSSAGFAAATSGFVSVWLWRLPLGEAALFSGPGFLLLLKSACIR
jgi:hypothetical protein